MDKENFIKLIENIKIAKITYFNISYKEYDINDEPTMTIQLEKGG